jgi:hypothetical protein
MVELVALERPHQSQAHRSPVLEVAVAFHGLELLEVEAQVGVETEAVRVGHLLLLEP